VYVTKRPAVAVKVTANLARISRRVLSVEPIGDRAAAPLAYRQFRIARAARQHITWLE